MTVGKPALNICEFVQMNSNLNEDMKLKNEFIQHQLAPLI